MRGVEPRLHGIQPDRGHVGRRLGRHDAAPQVALDAAIGGAAVAVVRHRHLPGVHRRPLGGVQQARQDRGGARSGGVLVDVRMGVVAHQHVGRAHHERRQVGMQVQGRHQRRGGPDRRADRLQDAARHVGVVDGRLRPVQGEQHPVDRARAQRPHGHLDQLGQQAGGERPARPGDRPAQADPLHRAAEDLRQLREPGQLAHVAVALDDVGAPDQAVVLEVGALGEDRVEGIGLLADLPDGDAFHDRCSHNGFSLSQFNQFQFRRRNPGCTTPPASRVSMSPADSASASSAMTGSIACT